MKKALFLFILAFSLIALKAQPVGSNANFKTADQFNTTPELIALVKDAAQLLRVRGEAAFKEFRIRGSRWRKEETYIFVLDPEGNMLVHADPAME